MKLEYKNFTTVLEKKEMEDPDFFYLKGMVSPYDGKPDLGGDIIEAGAYKRTLKQQGNQRTLLWSHNGQEPIGTIELTDGDKGLTTENSAIAKGVQRGKEAGILIGMKAIKGFSIGYQAVKVAYDKGNRILKEIALHEVSVVWAPMNTGSTINGIKSQVVGGDFKDALEYVLNSLESATKSDIEMIQKAVNSFNALLIEVKKADPLCSAKADEEKRLIVEAERKILLDFKTFIKETVK